MRNTALLLFTFVILTASSQENPNVKDQQLSEDSFKQFVDDIPLLQLPFELSTSDPMYHLNMESKYIPEGAALIGRLKSRLGKHLIIYSYPADIRLPILEVYDNDGKKLNELQLFDYMSCPMTASGFSRFIIRSEEIYKETACDIYDSRIDQDTIRVNDLLKNE